MSRRSDLSARKSFESFPSTSGPPPSRSESILLVQENERKRLSRELHDELGQGLMTLRLSLGALIKDSTEDVVRARAAEALDVLDSTIEGLRRIIARSSPRPVEDLGLLGAIRREADLLSKHTGMKSHLSLPEDISSIDYEAKIAVYRSVQEALHNIWKHSRGRNFAVSLEQTGCKVKLLISDDGEGMPASIPSETFGIAGMRERIEEIGGTFRIQSKKRGGTQLLIEIPLTPADVRQIIRAQNLVGKAS